MSLGTFSPAAYYDKHMDSIYVFTHDRSVTGHRIDEVFTVYECNHRTQFDPEYVGFAIKGVRHLFSQLNLPLDGVYRLTEIINKLVNYRPDTTMSEILRLFVNSCPKSVEEIEVSLADAEQHVAA
jgi:hypothetical protein